MIVDLLVESEILDGWADSPPLIPRFSDEQHQKDNDQNRKRRFKALVVCSNCLLAESRRVNPSQRVVEYLDGRASRTPNMIPDRLLAPRIFDTGGSLAFPFTTLISGEACRRSASG